MSQFEQIVYKYNILIGNIAKDETLEIRKSECKIEMHNQQMRTGGPRYFIVISLALAFMWAR